MAKNYGYARCSLGEEKGQDLNRQIRELKAAGADEIAKFVVDGGVFATLELPVCAASWCGGKSAVCNPHKT